MSINLPIHNFKIFAERPVLNQLRLVQIKDWSKTGLRPRSSVFFGPVRSFSVLGWRQTGLGLGPWILGQKTGPDRTSKHYSWGMGHPTSILWGKKHWVALAISGLLPVPIIDYLSSPLLLFSGYSSTVTFCSIHTRGGYVTPLYKFMVSYTC
jgi:hypothetical protein